MPSSMPVMVDIGPGAAWSPMPGTGKGDAA
jgi:hypothetical protein